MTIMARAEKFLADSQAVIDEWDGMSLDAASWAADGSHETPNRGIVWCGICEARPVNGPGAERCARCEQRRT